MRFKFLFGTALVALVAALVSHVDTNRTMAPTLATTDSSFVGTPAAPARTSIPDTLMTSQSSYDSRHLGGAARAGSFETLSPLSSMTAGTATLNAIGGLETHENVLGLTRTSGAEENANLTTAETLSAMACENEAALAYLTVNTVNVPSNNGRGFRGSTSSSAHQLVSAIGVGLTNGGAPGTRADIATLSSALG